MIISRDIFQFHLGICPKFPQDVPTIIYLQILRYIYWTHNLCLPIPWWSHPQYPPSCLQKFLSWVTPRFINRFGVVSSTTNRTQSKWSAMVVMKTIYIRRMRIGIPSSLWACSAVKLDKTDIYWVLYGIHNFVFLTLLRIFVPRLEILLFINHYFLVCIFKYFTSSRVNYGL